MSLTKRLLFDKDPTLDDVRRTLAEGTWRYLEQFKFRIATRRRNGHAAKPYWDPLWPASLNRAAEELKIEAKNINDGVFVRTAEERDAIQALAEEIWKRMSTRGTPPKARI